LIGLLDEEDSRGDSDDAAAAKRTASNYPLPSIERLTQSQWYSSILIIE